MSWICMIRRERRKPIGRVAANMKEIRRRIRRRGKEQLELKKTEDENEEGEEKKDVEEV